MTYDHSFSPDYHASRARFQAAAHALGWNLNEYKIPEQCPDGEQLTIDSARVGPIEARNVLVVSSGLHGVEGFMGAAVQAALMEEFFVDRVLPANLSVVFLHALNPFGFAWVRRVNEHNVDLNRNFLKDGEPYSGAPDGYRPLYDLLNPKGMPKTYEPFALVAGARILQHGMPAMKDAVAGGQYKYPKGVFFGGDGPSRTMNILKQQMPILLGQPERVLHVDFHTGLGRKATYKLLIDRKAGSSEASKLAEQFGKRHVQPWQSNGVSYTIRGGMGTWLQSVFPKTEYDVLTAEFGTFNVLRIIGALRRENQVVHNGKPGDEGYLGAKNELKEVFCPRDKRWRNTVVSRGVKIVSTALDVLSE